MSGWSTFFYPESSGGWVILILVLVFVICAVVPRALFLAVVAVMIPVWLSEEYLVWKHRRTQVNPQQLPPIQDDGGVAADAAGLPQEAAPARPPGYELPNDELGGAGEGSRAGARPPPLPLDRFELAPAPGGATAVVRLM